MYVLYFSDHVYVDLKNNKIILVSQIKVINRFLYIFIFGPIRGEISEAWGMLHIKKLCCLYSTFKIVTVVKLSRDGWTHGFGKETRN
jgi:hypothetical protein